jgi:hypothetical protein
MAGAVSIRKALETRLAAIASPLATQWENTKYVPVADTPYQRVTILLADPANVENSARYQELGFMQIDLRYPVNNGPLTVWAKAQAVRDWFPRGLTLTADSVNVTINKTTAISVGFIDDDRYVISTKVPFYSNAI